MKNTYILEIHKTQSTFFFLIFIYTPFLALETSQKFPD